MQPLNENGFQNLISAHQHNPRVLFKTVDRLVNPASPCAPAESDADCEMYLSYFTDKLESIQASINPSATYSDVLCSQQDSWSLFYLITLSELLVSDMRVSSSPHDVIPTKFSLKVMESVGPCLLPVFNSCFLQSDGCVPDYFKTACVNPLIKKPGLDPQNYRPISKLLCI